MSRGRKDYAMASLKYMYGEDVAKCKFEDPDKAQRDESDDKIGYLDMLLPAGSQFYPSMITAMGR